MSFSISDLAGTSLPQATSVVQPTPTQPTQPTQPTPTQQPSASGVFTMKDLGAEEFEQQSQTKPALSPEEQASQTRQMLISGLTGMPTPNMTAEDRANFEKGKAAGAVSVPVVAAGTAGLTAISEALPSVLPHTIDGVRAIGTWANAHPVQAYILYQVIRDLVPGAKKAMGLIKGVPEVE